MYEEISNNEGLAGGLVLRPASERGQANFGWLNSFHTFSFGSYRDPEHVQFRNLRVINDDEVAPGQGFGEHPHQDAEIFSYVLEGALEHKDSMGNGSVVTAGGVQYMSGCCQMSRGKHRDTTHCRSNKTKKMDSSSYFCHRTAVIGRSGLMPMQMCMLPLYPAIKLLSLRYLTGAMRGFKSPAVVYM